MEYHRTRDSNTQTTTSSRQQNNQQPLTLGFLLLLSSSLELKVQAVGSCFPSIPGSKLVELLGRKVLLKYLVSDVFRVGAVVIQPSLVWTLSEGE
jgi:hypothetical protein